MPKDSGDDRSDLLTLFLDYYYLPVAQKAGMLLSLNGVYEAILYQASRHEPFFLGPMPWPEPNFQVRAGFAPVYGPPLCVTSVTTGSSITVKFAPEGTVFPRIAFQSGDLELLIPRWAAVALLVGAALTYGISRYSDFLEVQNRRLDNERLRLEIQRLQQTVLEDDPRLQISVQQFFMFSDTANINRCEINGVSTRRSR